MKRNIYISNMDDSKAMQIYMEKLIPHVKASMQEISTYDALGMITWEPVYANESSPCYNASAMDGIAVVSKNTKGATDTSPKVLKEGVDFEYVNTGNSIKEPYDSVIMIEDVVNESKGSVTIIAPSHPWQHVRPIGEDIVKGEMIVPSRHKIRPVDIGAMLSGAVGTVKAYKRPKIGIIPTGSELIEDFSKIEEGKIIESNSSIFKGRAEELGASARRYPPCSDEYETLRHKIEQGVRESDMLIINAGSSAGTKDYTAAIIDELGEVIVHGVALKPGKPTVLGIIGGKPVIGLPGYPVSAFIAFERFVSPIIHWMTGSNETEYEFIDANVSKRIPSSLKHKEIVRVSLGYVGERFIATPLTRGAGVTMSLVNADGMIEIPRNSEGVEAGEKVSVRLLKPICEIKNTLVSIGSHDVIMDEISDIMSMSSGHVGSMGGIMAMKRGECHIAPIHLLDEESGEYNVSYVKRFFPDGGKVLIRGVKRLQGFMVKRGNPKGVKSFKDLSRDDIVFVNRQRGAGTRVLLDYNLNKEGISSEDVSGYTREMTTHMAVAIAVKSGSADAGIGIYSAAHALGLEFIPIGYEHYDFLADKEAVNDSRVQEFIRILKSQEFEDRLQRLGGYKIEDSGYIIRVGEQVGE